MRFRPSLCGVCVAAALLLAPAGCAGRHRVAGVTDAGSRTILRAEAIVYVKQESLHLARGDGSDPRRLLAPDDAGAPRTFFHPELSPAGDRVAFISVTDLDVRESTGRDLSLEILTLSNQGSPVAASVSGRRRILLEKIAPPGSDGRQEIFTAAGLSWSRDGSRIAIGLNRPEVAGGDAVLIVDAGGIPLIQYDIAPNDLAPVCSISWSADASMLFLGGRIAQGEDAATGVVLRLTLDDPAGNRRASIAEVAPGGYPAVSPDGTKIAIVDERSGRSDLVLLDMTGREVERFLHPAGRGLSRPRWSADGRYLYYHSLASTGPLGLVDITMLRCLDTRTRVVFDLARL